LDVFIFQKESGFGHCVFVIELLLQPDWSIACVFQ